MTRELKSQRKARKGRFRGGVPCMAMARMAPTCWGWPTRWRRICPGTAFYAPNAPGKRCVNNPMGYQWFPIPWMDGSSEEQAKASAAQSFQDINAFLDKSSCG